MRHLHVQQFVDEGLGNTAHLVYANGSCATALVDPLLDAGMYRSAANALDGRVMYETLTAKAASSKGPRP